MSIDYFADQSVQISSLFSRLVQEESTLGTARQVRDNKARAQAERNLLNIRNQILEMTDPALAYLYLVATGKADAVALRTVWEESTLQSDIGFDVGTRGWDSFVQQFDAPAVDLTQLPPLSFSVEFTFRLAQPYLSKDDAPFHILDNPVTREKIFRLPFVRASSWKGNLYSALWHLGHDKKQEPEVAVRRMFGILRDAELGQAGRLRFYPTFFYASGLEVINPHDRQSGVGDRPIAFQSVPIGEQGNFSLLYVPFELHEDAPETTRVDVADDLRLTAEGLRAMFCLYGFSAKRTSGYGMADDGVEDGVLRMNLPPAEEAALQFDSLGVLVERAQELAARIVRE